MANAKCSINSDDCCNHGQITRGWCEKHYKRFLRHGDPLIARKLKVCSINDCTEKHFGKSFCRKHYSRWLKHGNPNHVHEHVKSICSIDGCDKHVTGHGYCEKHYRRLRTHGDPNRTRPGVPYGEALEWLKKAFLLETDECIEYPYRLDAGGYGLVHYEGKRWVTSRLIMHWEHGEIPEGMIALHAPIICHNRSCVNKRHIRIGTHKENALDRFLDNTIKEGVKNYRAKVTEDQVRLIRKDPRKNTVIAEELNLTPTTIYDIKRRKTWRHI